MKAIRWLSFLFICLFFLGCPVDRYPLPPWNFNLVSAAEAQTIPGYDVLAVATYCKKFLEAPQLPAMSTLMNTFGDPLPCIEKRIQRGNLQVVQVDLIDATCWRNNACPAGVPRPDDLKQIKRRATQVNQLAVKYSSVEFWLSPALEHDIKSAGTVTKMMQAAQAGCPGCKVINSPFTGARPPQFEVEKHGTSVRAFSVSGDGASIFDGDNLQSDGNNFQHRTSGSYTTFAWWNELNNRCTGEKTFTPPLKRTNRPTADQFRQAYLTMQPEQPRPAVPAQCKEVRDIKPGKEIIKPNAEAYCNGQPGESDKRGNRPLLIIQQPGKLGDRANILSPSGKVVGCFAYYGTFTMPGTHRWYEGNCSGLTPAQLFDALGGEWGYMQLKGGKCIRFNSIRRQGTYR